MITRPRVLACFALLVASAVSGQVPPASAPSVQGSGCTHFVAVCGGTYFGMLPSCTGTFDVYDLTVEAGVTIVAHANSDLGVPVEVSITDPAGIAVAINPFLAHYVTRIAGVHTIGVAYAHQPIRYALGIRCDPGPPSCVADDFVLCLQGTRFSVTTAWRTDKGAGAGRAVQLTEDAGYFWFFDPDNVEVVVKILDACQHPFDHYWLFAGGLTNVSVAMTVLDTITGLAARG